MKLTTFSHKNGTDISSKKMMVAENVEPEFAEEIVRAVNNHDALLDALKSARIALTFYRERMERVETHTKYVFGIEAEKAARAAIASAEKE